MTSKVASQHPVQYHSDSDTERTNASTVFAIAKADPSKKWWMASITLFTIGVLLAFGGDIAHSLHGIGMKSAMWFDIGGASSLFVAGCIALAKQHHKTAAWSLGLAGIILCLGSDLAHPGGVIDWKTSLGLDITGTVLLALGIIVRIGKYIKDRREAAKEARRPKFAAAVIAATKSTADAGVTVLRHPDEPRKTKTISKSFNTTTSLQVALLEKDPTVALSLLKKASTKIIPKDAIHNAMTQYCTSEDDGWKDVIHKLIEKGADLSQFKDTDGNNILTRAIVNKFSSNTVALILQKNPKLADEPNLKGKTPRHIGSKSRRPEIRRLFVTK